MSCFTDLLFLLIAVSDITTASTPAPLQSDPSCVETAYDNNSFDRRDDQTKLIIANYNVEFLFFANQSCTGHSLECPGEDCAWKNDTMAVEHMSYIASKIHEINADILILTETEDCCVLDYFITNYIFSNTSYVHYLQRGTDYYTGENVALLTKIDPINDIYRTTNSENYPTNDTICTSTSDTGSKTVSKHLIANFSGITNFPDFVLIGLHLLARPSDTSRCTQREAQAKVIANVIKNYNENTDYHNFVVVGDFNDYDNDYPDAHGHTSITNVMKYIKESANLTNTAMLLNQSERYTHWPQSSYEPSNDDCTDYTGRTSYVDQYDYIFTSTDLTDMIEKMEIYHDFCNVYSSDHLPMVVTLSFDATTTSTPVTQSPNTQSPNTQQPTTESPTSSEPTESTEMTESSASTTTRTTLENQDKAMKNTFSMVICICLIALI